MLYSYDISSIEYVDVTTSPSPRSPGSYVTWCDGAMTVNKLYDSIPLHPLRLGPYSIILIHSTLLADLFIFRMQITRKLEEPGSVFADAPSNIHLQTDLFMRNNNPPIPALTTLVRIGSSCFPPLRSARPLPWLWAHLGLLENVGHRLLMFLTM